MKRLWMVLGILLCLSVHANLAVSDLKVTSLPPWGIAIDYTVSGVTEESTNRLLTVSAVAEGVTNVAQTLVGDVECRNGAHRVYWNMAKDGITSATKQGTVTVQYLSLYLYCVIDLSAGSQATNYPVTYCDVPPTEGWTNAVYKTTKLVLKRVDPGSFIMGDDQTDESHRVMLMRPFYMGLFEVTQKQWELVMGSNPAYFSGDANPVEGVSYDNIRGVSSGAQWPESNAVDADSFLGKLRDRTKLDLDLPTEAQWEYACRAGSTTTYSYGDRANDDYMWYYSNSSSTTHEVGTKLPNKWGFYDMYGNVWEWCLDWHGTLAYGKDPKGSSSGSYRVLRGGSWYDGASSCTSSYRNYFYPSGDNRGYGFRLSRTLP